MGREDGEIYRNLGMSREREEKRKKKRLCVEAAIYNDGETEHFNGVSTGLVKKDGEFKFTCYNRSKQVYVD